MGMLLVEVARSIADDRPFDPFFQKHCVSCHGNEKPEAGLKLVGTATNFDDATTLAAWVRIHDRVAKAEMPPRDADQPATSERQAFLQRLKLQLHTASLARQKSEGRVLVRRLNRTEYQNTLHDLLGITTEVRSLLPEDSIVAGFDKISSGLETSATHLVRYQEAADRALADVLPDAIIPTEPIRRRLTGREFLDGRPKPNREGTAPFVRFEGDTIVLCATLYKHGSVHTSAVSIPGRYRIRASVGAVQNDGKPIPVLIGKISSDRFAHEKLEHILDIQDAPPTGRRVLEVVANLPRDEQIYLQGLGLIFFNDLKKQRNGEPVGDDFKGPGLAVDWIEIEGPLDAGVGYRQLFGSLPRVPQRFYEDAMAGKEIKTDWSQWNPGEFAKPHNRLRLISKDAQADAERLIREFIPRAFRRQVPEEIIATFLQPARQQLERGEPLEEVLLQTYKTVLCSPYFLMLVEKPGELDDFALASRLSYFLWDSMPDAELLTVAARGELRNADVLRAQTERLLNDRKAARFTESFTGQWLELRKIHEMKPDAMYVEYDDLLAWSMPGETRHFFDEVLRNNLPTTSFFDSDWTMLNQRLAKHYGLQPAENTAESPKGQQAILGMDLRRVTLPKEAHRGGVITHASVLKLSTNATYTSPVKRGVWVLEKIVGTPPSPPPPNVAAIEPDIRGAITIREQLMKHKSVATCAACHTQIDPPGFALENFDVVGGWRDFYRSKEGGAGNQYVELKNYPGKKAWQAKPVEPSGELASGESFANIDDYRALVLRDRDQLTRNLAEKLLVYSTGSPLQFADREEIERIVASVRSRNHGFRTLVHETVQSRVFRSK
ncbi:MAG: DUF1592 domain-containing protein [Planctomycetaceae bacterium]